MAEKEQVIQALRATLLSVKGALTIKQCNRDYRELQGEWIPFKKLGYPTIEKLFMDVPGFKISQVNGDWYVDAIASQETQHIAAMVAKQKSSKRTGPKLYQPSRFPKRQDSWHKPTNNYSQSYNNQYSKQYYRAQGPSYTNNQSPKYNSRYSSKPTETKSNTQYTKPVRSNSDINDTSPPSHHQTAKKIFNNASSYKPKPETEKSNNKSSNRVESKPAVKSVKISASQRLSNLRENTNTVDLIPLQLPAVNDYEETAPVAQLELPPDSSSVAKLEWTCTKLGLPEPVYKVLDYKPNRGPVTYNCAVKVGTQYNATSYPDPQPTNDLARELAAAKLLAVIESSEAPGLPTSSSSKAMSCLADLVAEHEAGLWANTVPHLYREKYNESLPSDWQDLVESCSRIIKDRLANGLLVLLPKNEETSLTGFETTTISFDDTIDSDLPPLQFPEQNCWNVFVTVANSTIEIWLRIIGPSYSDAFESLLAEMGEYYDSHGTHVDKAMLIENAWYAVNLEEGGGWQRAKILEIDDESVTVFLGDHGDDDVVPLDNIKILETQFRKLPAQGILCRLEGAEELAACTEAGELVRSRLLGQVLVAEPGPRDDPADPAVAVVLHDTSTQNDLNLNKEIVNDFCTAAAFKITQRPCEVEIGCVTDEGRVWVSRAGGAATVRAALALLTSPGPYRRPLPTSPAAPPPAGHDALYIVRTIDGDWVRCTLISGLDGEGTVRTQLVDSGLILRAPLSSLVPLKTFSSALNSYPRQALQVRLGEAERAARSAAARLRTLLTSGAPALCRALGAAPHVELFMRVMPQNILASVNKHIIMEYEEGLLGKSIEEKQKIEDVVEALHKKKERIFRTASTPDERAGPLPVPELPKPGKCFDVFIAMAASPWNFVVQPNSTRHTLQSMMATLQVECPKLTEADAPLSPSCGELYTALYNKDSSWYRVTIAGTVSTEMVSVYFCDYGDLAVLSTKALRPVPQGAPLARLLPPQAIKAKLHDVWPLHKDWTVEDCIRFQELCVEQQFVGICKEVGRDPLENEPLLTLDLIDTTTPDDIYLNKVLVNEGRARVGSSSN